MAHKPQRAACTVWSWLLSSSAPPPPSPSPCISCAAGEQESQDGCHGIKQVTPGGESSPYQPMWEDFPEKSEGQGEGGHQLNSKFPLQMQMQILAQILTRDTRRQKQVWVPHASFSAIRAGAQCLDVWQAQQRQAHLEVLWLFDMRSVSIHLLHLFFGQADASGAFMAQVFVIVDFNIVGRLAQSIFLDQIWTIKAWLSCLKPYSAPGLTRRIFKHLFMHIITGEAGPAATGAAAAAKPHAFEASFKEQAPCRNCGGCPSKS